MMSNFDSLTEYWMFVDNLSRLSESLSVAFGESDIEIASDERIRSRNNHNSANLRYNCFLVRATRL